MSASASGAQVRRGGTGAGGDAGTPGGPPTAPGRGRSPGRPGRPPLPPGFGVLWTTVAVDLVGFGIVLPILPLYAERFGASPAAVGALVASFSAAQLVFSPLWGRVSDRFGRRPVLLVSLFGTALGSLLTGLAPNLVVLFAGRILDGASGASVSVAQAAVTDIAPPVHRARLLGLLASAFGVGFVLGPAIGSLAALGGPQIPFFVAAAVAFGNALVAIVRLPETSHRGRALAPAGAVGGAPAPAGEGSAAPGGGPVGAAEAGEAPTPAEVALAAPAADAGWPVPLDPEAVEPLGAPPVASAADGAGSAGSSPDVGPEGPRWAVLARLILVGAVSVMAFSGFEATFALYGERRFALTIASTAAVFVGIGVLAVIVQAGLVGPVVERFGPVRTARVSLVVNAAGFAVLAVAVRWPVLVLGLVLVVLGQGLLGPTLSSMVAGVARDDRRGTTLGVQQGVYGAARVVGPAGAGVAFQELGSPSPLLMGAVLLVAAWFVVDPAVGRLLDDATGPQRGGDDEPQEEEAGDGTGDGRAGRDLGAASGPAGDADGAPEGATRWERAMQGRSGEGGGVSAPGYTGSAVSAEEAAAAEEGPA